MSLILTVGDDVNTDDIIPAHRTTNPDPQHQKHYVLEHLIGIDEALKYDIIEAGYNFGCGSSREYAALAIKAAGIELVRARSFAEIFYRNSINIGLKLEIIGEKQDNPVLSQIAEAGGLTAFNLKRSQLGLEVHKSNTQPRPMTVTEKMLARASGNNYVQPGEVVFAKVDLAMSHDAIAAPVFRLFQKHFDRERGRRSVDISNRGVGIYQGVWDVSKVVLVADHFIQVNDIRNDAAAPKLYQDMVAFAKEYNVRLFDMVSPGEAAGICHVLLPEEGLIKPGMIIAGTDSHSCTYGALGSLGTGVGTTDMANILATGELWLRVPETIVIELTGKLQQGISAKDIMLFILGQIGCQGATSKVIEFRGSVIKELPMDERMTLSNMAIECGAMYGLIAPDEITKKYLQDKTDANWSYPVANKDAQYSKVYSFDLSKLEPQIACPPKPDRVVNISELPETAIDVAFIGSCTGGKLTDLAQAAEVLKDRSVAKGVQMYIVPASQTVQKQAEELGYLHIFQQAGASLVKSGCGACINSGKGVLGAKQTGIYATNRNFKGRSGDPTAHNYLASPRVVAISAVKGKISDSLS